MYSQIEVTVTIVCGETVYEEEIHEFYYPSEKGLQEALEDAMINFPGYMKEHIIRITTGYVQ